MMDSSINNGICRCCASEGTFKDMKTSYHWMGDVEIYSEMLKECFDISLISADNGEEGGVCEVCITQLRNASNFKKQVQHTEEQFKLRLQGKLFKSDIVKIEPAKEDDYGNDSDHLESEDFSGPEFEVPIKTESVEEAKPKKRAAAAKATTSRAKKAKTSEGETSTKQGSDLRRCQICNVEFRSTFNLKRHLRIKHNSDAVPTARKLCEGCGKVFFNDEYLAKHLAVGCASKARTCVKCNLGFDRKSEMYKHMRRLHWAEYRILKFSCPLCAETLKSHEEHDSHMSSHHEVQLDYHELTFDCMEDLNQWKDDVETKENVCFLKRNSSTGGTYYSCYPAKYLGCSRKRGKPAVCPARIELVERGGVILVSYQSTHVCDKAGRRKASAQVFCPVCEIRLGSYEELNTHLKEHDIEVKTEDLKFRSMEDFLKWKSKIERESVQFYKRSSAVSTKSGHEIRKSYFFCTKSSKTAKKTGKTCPARITLTCDEKLNTFDVVYQSTHVGHALDTLCTKLNKEERLMLANRIRNGDNFSDILNDAHITGDDGSKLKKLKKSDLYNVIRDFNIDRNIVNYGRVKNNSLNESDVFKDNIEVLGDDRGVTKDVGSNYFDLDQVGTSIMPTCEPEIDKMTKIYILKLKKA